MALLAGAYLSCWPVDAEPQAWTPPPSPPLEGSWKSTDQLSAIERRIEGEGVGPEDVAIDATGRVFTGFEDGRIVSFAPDGSDLRTLATLPGRPLGMEFDRSGQLIVADGRGGIVSVSPQGAVVSLVDAVQGEALVFADDLDIAQDGTIWFSEASRRFAVDEAPLDAVEGVPTGRLLAYDPRTRQTEVHLRELRYANGVSVAPGDAFVVVAETFGYRVTRLWLAGPRQGEVDRFAEGLPGLPDNVQFDDDGNLWVALVKERSGVLDTISESPGLRKVLFRLPRAWVPVPSPIAWVAVFDPSGSVRHSLRGETNFGDITSAYPHADTLWLGSLTMTAVGSVPRPRVVAAGG